MSVCYQGSNRDRLASHSDVKEAFAGNGAMVGFVLTFESLRGQVKRTHAIAGTNVSDGFLVY